MIKKKSCDSPFLLNKIFNKLNVKKWRVGKKWSTFTVGSTPQGGGFFKLFLEIFSNYDLKAHGGAVAVPNFQAFSFIGTPKTMQNIDPSNGWSCPLYYGNKGKPAGKYTYLEFWYFLVIFQHIFVILIFFQYIFLKLLLSKSCLSHEFFFTKH